MLSVGQVSAGTASVPLCIAPPGPCLILVSNPSRVTVYVGPGGTALTASNGSPVPSGQVVAWPGYPAGQRAALSVIAASGSANSVGFLVSSASGGTGP